MRSLGHRSVRLFRRSPGGRELGALTLLLVAVGLAGCSSGGRGLEKPRGSVVWVTPDAGPVDEEVLERLETVGVREAFFEVGELSWTRGFPDVTAAWQGIAPWKKMPLTLVVSGEVPPDEVDIDTAAESLGEQARRLELEAQGRGLSPVGFHLDWRFGGELPEPDRLEAVAELQEKVARRLEPQTFLSATVDRRLLVSEESRNLVRDLVRSTDFTIVFAYGQRPGEREEDAAWRLAEVESAAARLEESGREYLLGVVVLGQAQHLDARGRSLETTTDVGLGRLLDAPGLEIGLGQSLEALDRRVYTFRARTGARVLGWRLEEREEVRLIGLTTGHLRRLLEHLDTLPLEHLLGQTWYRPPRPDEEMSLRLGAVATALSRQVPDPKVHVRLLADGRGAFRVAMTNPGSEATEIARVGSNFVELTAERGSFARAESGEFERYDFLDRRTRERSLRRPGILRLYAPYVAPGRTLTSGRVRLSGGGLEDVSIGGEFLMPDGTVAPVVAE